nr:GntR family transcriptional regulator [Candidatus Desulfobia pelagia]
MMAQLTRTVKSGLVELIREEIVRGIYKPGERLRLEDIAAQYEVSTMPVREALRDLEAEGLVMLYPHKGAVVTEMSPEELADIYDIRAFLVTTQATP